MSTRMTNLMLVLLVGLFTLAACGGGGPSVPNLPAGENPVGYKFAASDLTRDNSPDVPGGNLSELVNGNTEFGFDLYKVLITDEDGNLFFSPFSISQALAMAWAGTRMNTEVEIADTMHFTLPQSDLHPAFNQLDLKLASRGQNAKGKDGQPFRLKIANAMWGQDGWSWQPDFLDTIAVNYGAGMRLVDFETQPEQCRGTINKWVEDRTENRIKDLLPEGVIDSYTRMVLVNAIYFNAAWLYQFEKEATQDGTFTLLDGTDVTVPMMHEEEDHRYMEGDGYKVCEMMYDGEDIAMTIILPDTGRFDEIQGLLSAEFLAGVVDGLHDQSVLLSMPKFEFEFELGLSDTLQEMGIVDAFIPGTADFSGMDGSMSLYVTDVLHKAFVAVDEEGTEAAAATAVIIGYSSAPLSVEFNANRPFIFMIRDLETGAVLFLGRVMDPR